MTPNQIRNRIKSHRRVRAGDLVPHELNFRFHPANQKYALEALYREVGFARSLLAYELPDGRLKLLDGHLRRDIDPDMEVDVEILDVNEEEARTLLLSIDPLAALAETQYRVYQSLRQVAPPVPDELSAAWDASIKAVQKITADPKEKEIREQWLVLITCRNEKHQVELLERLGGEGLQCKALMS
jgi:hypothetical protein